MGLCYNVAIKKVGARECWGGDSLPLCEIQQLFIYVMAILIKSRSPKACILSSRNHALVAKRFKPQSF
jgi:hypothetical protein